MPEEIKGNMRAVEQERNGMEATMNEVLNGLMPGQALFNMMLPLQLPPFSLTHTQALWHTHTHMQAVLMRGKKRINMLTK